MSDWGGPREKPSAPKRRRWGCMPLVVVLLLLAMIGIAVFLISGGERVTPTSDIAGGNDGNTAPPQVGPPVDTDWDGPREPSE